MTARVSSLDILASIVTDVVRGRRARRDRLASAAVADALGGWAAAAGFSIVDPFDADVIDRSEEAFLLCACDEHREVGSALRRSHARGALYLLDSYSPDGVSGRAATGVITTSAAIHLQALPGEVPDGWERRRTRHSLIVHAPGPLDAALAGALAEWLSRAEAALPRVPGSARL